MPSFVAQIIQCLEVHFGTLAACELARKSITHSCAKLRTRTLHHARLSNTGWTRYSTFSQQYQLVQKELDWFTRNQAEITVTEWRDQMTLTDSTRYKALLQSGVRLAG